MRYEAKSGEPWRDPLRPFDFYGTEVESHHPSSGREVALSDLCLKKIIPAIFWKRMEKETH